MSAFETPARRGQPLQVLVMILMGWLAIRLIWAGIETKVAEPEGGWLGGFGSDGQLPTIGFQGDDGEVASGAPPVPGRDRPAKRLAASDTDTLWAGFGAWDAEERARTQLLIARRMLPGVFGGARPIPASYRREVEALAPGKRGGERLEKVLQAELPERRDRRWSVYAYAFWRPDGGAAPIAGTAQYGAGQAGVIVRRRIGGAASGLSAFARLTASPSTRLSDAQQDAAGGLEWQPVTALPVRFAAEQRVSIAGGGRNAPALFATAALPAQALPARIELRAYGQAGVVGVDDPDYFYDAQLAATRAVGSVASARFDLGGGAWAGGQTGTGRLDLGPRLNISVPVRGGPDLGLAVDWRQRVAGDAAPGSGITLTLSTSF